MEVRAEVIATGNRNLARRTRRHLVIALGAAAVVSMANAEPSGVEEDPRTVASTGESSSECVGDPRTPLCALDTWKACFMWGEPSMCEKVGLPGMVFRRHTGERSGFVLSYHVDAVLDIEARHLTRLPSDQRWFRPGYVDLRYVNCAYEDRDKCAAQGSANVLILKPVGLEWHVSGWLIDAGDVTCENYSWERDYPPWDHECQLNISTREFSRYEVSRALAE